MHHVLNPTAIAEWLAAWGYLGIFICVFAGNVGIPLPEETVILVAGFLAGRDILDLKTVYAVVVLSAVAGDCCGYLLGCTGGQRLLERLAANFDFVRKRYDRLQLFFRMHGSKAVFMARFVTGARFMSGPMAGAAGMRFWQFLGWNLFGALIWCPLIVTIGYLVSDELWLVVRMTRLASYWLALGVALLLAAIWILWWRERRQARSQP
jgi:membrane protein DedA with SNARE-associated domain